MVGTPHAHYLALALLKLLALGIAVYSPAALISQAGGWVQGIDARLPKGSSHCPINRALEQQRK